jgi:hypothetical protein
MSTGTQKRRVLSSVAEEDILRLWSHIKVDGEDACWEWTGSTSNLGFPEIAINGETHSVLRVLYLATRGVIEHKHNVLHHCRNIGCVNPRHLVQHRNINQSQFDQIVELGDRYSIREIQALTGLSFSMIQKTLRDHRESQLTRSAS